jgi:hypothetical protein
MEKLRAGEYRQEKWGDIVVKSKENIDEKQEIKNIKRRNEDYYREE